MSFFGHKHPGDAAALIGKMPYGLAMHIAELKVKLVAKPFFESDVKKAVVPARKGVRITLRFECTTSKPTNLSGFPKQSCPLHIQYFSTHSRTHTHI